MVFFKRSLPLALIAAALLSSCSTLCCDKVSSRIEADIAIATNRKEDVEAIQKDAYKRISWAKEFGLEKDFPGKYQAALDSLNPADLAYDNMKYATAKQLYLEVTATLSDDFKDNATQCREERARVEQAMTRALEACADTLATLRFKDAQDLLIKAQALKASDDLPNAIATCKKATAAFEYAAEYARVMQLRDSIKDCEVLKSYNKEYLQAESKILEDEALWKHGTVKDYALGISILKEAGRQYLWIAEQCRKLAEEKRIAAERAVADGALLCARSGMAWAVAQHLDVDYSADYAKAKALLDEAEAAYKAKDYVTAAASANQVCSLFTEGYKASILAERNRLAQLKAAADKLAAEKALADSALACARSGTAWADEQRLDIDHGADYSKAKALLAEAEVAYKAGDYVTAASVANQICNLFTEGYKSAVLAERDRLAKEKAAAEKLAADKAVADGALACARSGMAWADEQRLDIDYGADYTRAKALLAEADAAYSAGDYIKAAEAANQICSLFTDSYKAAVLAERDRLAREKAAAEKAAADKLAAEKAAADGALACARTGANWAEEQRLDIDYSVDYAQAKALLAEADAAYAAGDYLKAAAAANQICSLYSDGYRAAVLAERDRLAREKSAADKAAADKLAAEKAMADGALACARSGTAWAEEQRLDLDYSADYTQAKALLAEAEAANAAGDYLKAAAVANQICSLYSDGYRAAVLAERDRLAREKAAAEKLAAEKAMAGGALACARSGTAWADEQRLDLDYGADYAQAKALLAEAEAANAAGDYLKAYAAANQICSMYSDAYKNAVLTERDRLAREKAAAEKAAADKLAAEKAIAGAALVCARSGIAWADEQRLDVDYGEDYARAKALLAEAEAANAAGNYLKAAELANQVCALYSDNYRSRILAEREKLAQEKAKVVPAVVKTSPEYFSPDNDGTDDVMTFDTFVPGDVGVKQWVLEVFEEYIVDPSAKSYSVSKRSFRIWTGNGTPPERLPWNGKSDKDELVQSGTTYPYSFSYTDKQDRVTTTQGAIIVGIIAQRTGDTINIRLPALVFRADKADFLDLDAQVVERNNLLIGKLADSLKKYSDYNITIEGHANNVGKIMGYTQVRIQEEEKTQVLPLSSARAEKLRLMLTERGIDTALISVVGYGSSRPVVSFQDAVNRWKNRRVEFTLTKKNDALLR